MKEWAHLCPGCFNDKGNAEVCPHCGYDERLPRSPLLLKQRSLLGDQYLVGRVLGKPGGFGVTYLCWDTRLHTRVAIKEYLPREIVSRKEDSSELSTHDREEGEMFQYGKEQFLKEAQTLAKFDHPNVMRVRTFFEANNTAYLVMDYYEGVTLAEHLASSGGVMSEEKAIALMMPVLDGLREVHKLGFLHRDIKPQNIYITKEGRVILLDFGAARQAMGERSRALSVILTPGYAPHEQYSTKGRQGPWTDIYSCGAVLYKMITGQEPPDSVVRVIGDEAFSYAGMSDNTRAAIATALEVEIGRRPQSIQAFQNMLRGGAAGTVKLDSVPGPGSAVTAKLPESAFGDANGLGETPAPGISSPAPGAEDVTVPFYQKGGSSGPQVSPEPMRADASGGGQPPFWPDSPPHQAGGSSGGHAGPGAAPMPSKSGWKIILLAGVLIVLAGLAVNIWDYVRYNQSSDRGSRSASYDTSTGKDASTDASESGSLKRGTDSASDPQPGAADKPVAPAKTEAQKMEDVIKLHYASIPANMTQARNCFSSRRIQQEPSWGQSGFETTVKDVVNSVAIQSQTAATGIAVVNMTATDYINGQYSNVTYVITWEMVNENGSWKMDRVADAKTL